MPSFDDRLRRDLEGLARPADPSGALDRIADRKRRLPRTRRIQALTMSMVVLAATSGAGYGLYRAFGLDKPPPVSEVPTLSEPTGRIAFLRHEEDGTTDLMGMSADGTEQVRLTDQPYLSSFSLDLTPDGGRVAFNVGIAGGKGAIDVVRSDGSVRERLSIPEFFNPADPAWSPDGEELAWSAGNTNPPGIHVGAEVGGLRQLTVPPETCTDVHPSWSPDGSRIAFVRSCAERSNVVMVVPAEGGDAEEVVAGRDVDWSPDGRSLLVVIATSTGEQYHQIYRYDLATEELVQLTTQSYNSAPSWSPDGDWIAFQSSRDGNDEIYVMRADGSGQRNITKDPAGDVAPSWGLAPQPQPESPVCAFDDLVALPGAEGGTPSMVVFISVKLSDRACTLKGDITLTLVDAQGRQLDVDGNPSTVEIGVDSTSGTPTAIWRWRNWCGSQKGVEAWFDVLDERVRLLLGDGPICDAPESVSTVGVVG